MRQADCGRRTGVGKWKAKCHLAEIDTDERKILIIFILLGVFVFVFETLIQKKSH
jgi:hypothetical protein